MTLDDFLTICVPDAQRRLIWWAAGVYLPVTQVQLSVEEVGTYDGGDQFWPFAFTTARNKVEILVQEWLNQTFAIKPTEIDPTFILSAKAVAEAMIKLNHHATHWIMADAANRLAELPRKAASS